MGNQVKKVFTFLLGLSVVIVLLALVVGWHFGVPYVAHKAFDQLSYSTYLAIWFGLYFVRNAIGRMILKSKLKKYEAIHNILGGKK